MHHQADPHQIALHCAQLTAKCITHSMAQGFLNVQQHTAQTSLILSKRMKTTHQAKDPPPQWKWVFHGLRKTF
jgi:hypothetical protein